MARKAFVSSDMAHDERLYDLSDEHPDAVMMWPWIVTWFDDWGRALASPKRIKSQLFPNLSTVSIGVIEDAIQAYADVGLIELYSDDSHRYMAIPMEKWFKWQTHIRSDKRNNDNSKFPPCPTDCAQVDANSAQVRADARDSAQVSADRDPSLTDLLDLSPTPTKNISNKESPPTPNDLDVQDPYKAVEDRMSMHMGKPFVVKGEGYHALKTLIESEVPLQFILEGVDVAFERNKQVSAFQYCAKVIEGLWTDEIAKNKPVQRFDWQVKAHARRAESKEPQLPAAYFNDLTQDPDIIRRRQQREAALANANGARDSSG